MVVDKSLKSFQKIFTDINSNEWYWNFDNDYKMKYNICKQVANGDICTNESYNYAWNLLLFLNNANKRIFKR